MRAAQQGAIRASAAIIIYYPFFKAWERILVAREEAATIQSIEKNVRIPAGVRERSTHEWLDAIEKERRFV